MHASVYYTQSSHVRHDHVLLPLLGTKLPLSRILMLPSAHEGKVPCWLLVPKGAVTSAVTRAVKIIIEIQHTPVFLVGFFGRPFPLTYRHTPETQAVEVFRDPISLRAECGIRIGVVAPHTCGRGDDELEVFHRFKDLRHPAPLHNLVGTE